MVKIAEVDIVAPSGVTPVGNIPLEFILPVPDGKVLDVGRFIAASVNGETYYGTVQPWMAAADGAVELGLDGAPSVDAYKIVFVLPASTVGQTLNLDDTQVAAGDPALDGVDTSFSFHPELQAALAGNDTVAMTIKDHADRLYGGTLRVLKAETHRLVQKANFTSFKTVTYLTKTGLPLPAQDWTNPPASKNAGMVVAYWSVYSGCPFAVVDLVWTSGVPYGAPGDIWFEKFVFQCADTLTVSARGATPFRADYNLLSNPEGVVDLITDAQSGPNVGKADLLPSMRSTVFRLVIGPTASNAQDRAYLEGNAHKRIVNPSTTFYSWCNATTAKMQPNGLPYGIVDSGAHATIDSLISTAINVRQVGDNQGTYWHSTLGDNRPYGQGPWFRNEPAAAGYSGGAHIWPLQFPELASYHPVGWFSALSAINDGFVNVYSYNAWNPDGTPFNWLNPDNVWAESDGIWHTQYGSIKATNPNTGNTVGTKFRFNGGNWSNFKDRNPFRGNNEFDMTGFREAAEDTQVRDWIGSQDRFPDYLGSGNYEKSSSQYQSHNIRNLRTTYAMAVFGGCDMNRDFVLQLAYDAYASFNPWANKGAWKETIEPTLFPEGYGAEMGRWIAWTVMNLLYARKLTGSNVFDDFLQLIIDTYLKARMSNGAWYCLRLLDESDSASELNDDDAGDWSLYSITQGYQQHFVQHAINSHQRYLGSTQVATAIGSDAAIDACEMTNRMTAAGGVSPGLPYKWCNYPIEGVGAATPYANYAAITADPPGAIRDYTYSGWSDQYTALPLAAALELDRTGGSEQMNLYDDWIALGSSNRDIGTASDFNSSGGSYFTRAQLHGVIQRYGLSVPA